MNEVRNFLKALNENPTAKELMKAAKEPANAEEAAALYADIAEKAGIAVSKETIAEFLKTKEKNQQQATAAAEGAVKAALSEDDLDNVAGGGANEQCASTYDEGEWCWFSDSCSYVVSYYDMNLKKARKVPDPDPELDPLKDIDDPNWLLRDNSDFDDRVWDETPLRPDELILD